MEAIRSFESIVTVLDAKCFIGFDCKILKNDSSSQQVQEGSDYVALLVCPVTAIGLRMGVPSHLVPTSTKGQYFFPP